MAHFRAPKDQAAEKTHQPGLVVALQGFASTAFVTPGHEAGIGLPMGSRAHLPGSHNH